VAITRACWLRHPWLAHRGADERCCERCNGFTQPTSSRIVISVYLWNSLQLDRGGKARLRRVALDLMQTTVQVVQYSVVQNHSVWRSSATAMQPLDGPRIIALQRKPL
jgi:hypothetical protein